MLLKWAWPFQLGNGVFCQHSALRQLWEHVSASSRSSAKLGNRTHREFQRHGSQREDMTSNTKEQSKGRKQRRGWLIGVVAALVLADIFQPGLVWIVFSAMRRNPVMSAHFEAFIPRDWMVTGSGDSIFASRTQACFTRFCTSSTDGAGVAIHWSQKLARLLFT